MTIGSITIGVALFVIAIWVLVKFDNLAHRLQNVYVRAAERGGLLILPPKYWKTPYSLFIFRLLVIFFGIWLILISIVVGHGGAFYT